MKPAAHISFFRGFLLSWHQEVGGAAGAAIADFERALDATAFTAGEKPWEQVRDEAFLALTERQRSLIAGSPLLIVRRNLEI